LVESCDKFGNSLLYTIFIVYHYLPPPIHSIPLSPTDNHFIHRAPTKKASANAETLLKNMTILSLGFL
jgi:hypothetical protein